MGELIMEKLYSSANYIVLKNYFERFEEEFNGSIPPVLYPDINKDQKTLEKFAKETKD